MTATMVDANENFWGKLDLREYLLGKEETNCDLAWELKGNFWNRVLGFV